MGGGGIERESGTPHKSEGGEGGGCEVREWVAKR